MTQLGKIRSVEFGISDGMLGFHFDLSGQGWNVSYSKTAWGPSIEHNERCQWSEDGRMSSHAKNVMEIGRLMIQANVANLSDLINVPIEAEFDQNTLKSWRILTEVL